VHIKPFQTGGNRNLGYLVADEVSRQALVIDPSYDPKSIVDYAEAKGYRITYILCTHGHGDHTNGNADMQASTGIKPLVLGDTDPKTGKVIQHEVELPLGELRIRILHTPGHTDDSACFHVGDAVFTGDTLFVGKVGGTDLGDAARTEYASLHKVLMVLPDETRVFPGHDVGVQPESTIGHERATNPFLLREDVESFIDLKRNWDEYKREHGIA